MDPRDAVPTKVGFHLAYAKKLEAIAQAETKTDSVDARLLARMLEAGRIPEVYPKPADQREVCRLIRHRNREQVRCNVRP